MRYDDESDYPYDYDSVIANTDFDYLADLYGEEKVEETEEDSDIPELEDYYSDIADDDYVEE